MVHGRAGGGREDGAGGDQEEAEGAAGGGGAGDEMNGGSTDSDDYDYDEDVPKTAVIRPGAGLSRGDDSREGGPSVNTQHGTRSPHGSAVPSTASKFPFAGGKVI